MSWSDRAVAVGPLGCSHETGRVDQTGISKHHPVFPFSGRFKCIPEPFGIPVFFFCFVYLLVFFFPSDKCKKNSNKYFGAEQKVF